MSFIVNNLVETRNDNPLIKGYEVSLDGRGYVLSYDNKALREVYIFGWENDKYFMSCRTDMKTISHYYWLDENTIVRYENGILNRTYVCERNTTKCLINGNERVYTTNYCEVNDKIKFYRDLVNFLEAFNQLGLWQQAKPFPC